MSGAPGEMGGPGKLTLAQHAYVCVDGDYVVFLDVKADRYWALAAAQTAGLGRWLSGWPVPAFDDASCGTDEVASMRSVLDVLNERELLVEESAGKQATPVTATPPSSALTLPESLSGRGGGLFRVLAASAAARLFLRMYTFRRTVEHVRARKRQMAHTGPMDLERARFLTGRFMASRMWLFSSRDECLQDSLSLIEYLAWHRIYPDWVFGVQAHPFAAHCWVQHEEIVFNDTVEHVREYTPIMIV